MKKKTVAMLLTVMVLSGLVGCNRPSKVNWQSVEPTWQKVVEINQGFKARVYADPKPSLRELYQKADANIELLNQLKGKIQAMDLPPDWQKNFNLGLEANISYYKCCQNIINKRALGGQSYEELRDCARDCIASYQNGIQEGWTELPRETFQIAAKLETLIVASRGQIPSAQPIIKRASDHPYSPFVTARGVGIYPDSQIRNLTQNDLIGRSAWELDIMRNEIYARHGRPFVKVKFARYFNEQSWYEVNPNYSDGLLSLVEKRNANLIKAYQDRTGLTTHD